MEPAPTTRKRKAEDDLRAAENPKRHADLAITGIAVDVPTFRCYQCTRTLPVSAKKSCTGLKLHTARSDARCSLEVARIIESMASPCEVPHPMCSDCVGKTRPNTCDACRKRTTSAYLSAIQTINARIDNHMRQVGNLIMAGEIFATPDLSRVQDNALFIAIAAKSARTLAFIGKLAPQYRELRESILESQRIMLEIVQTVHDETAAVAKQLLGPRKSLGPLARDAGATADAVDLPAEDAGAAADAVDLPVKDTGAAADDKEPEL